MAESQEPVTYHGNCHCGRYRFELSVPQIQTAISCTCSLCRKKGPFWLVPPEGAFRVVRDDGYLTEYQSPALRDRVRMIFPEAFAMMGPSSDDLYSRPL